MDPVTNYCEAILGDDESAKSAIRLIPEFSSCSDQLLSMVYRFSKPVNLDPGEILIEEGLFDQWVYFMVNGELDVVINDKNLGSTAGPIVGERCILGEPRGANLISGKDGVMALGVEMTIIDELFREVNDYKKRVEDEEEFLRFSEEKTAIALELLNIILSEIISRIINMHEQGVKSFDLISKARPSLKVQLQSLYTFSDGDFEKTIKTAKTSESLSFSSSKTEDHQKTSQSIPVYSFEDFVEIAYFEILQKHLSSMGYENFPQEKWREVFTVSEDQSPTLSSAYEWLKDQYQLTNSHLIEITYSLFEVASKYTAAANKSISQILSISDCDDEKREIMDETAADERNIAGGLQDEIKSKLFQPIEEKLSTDSAGDSDPGKMSQADIDALFG